MEFTPAMIDEVVDYVRRGIADKVSKAISQGLSPNAVSSQGRTLLIEAVMNRHFNMTSQLLLCGADPLEKGECELSALDYAEIFKDNKILQVLRKALKPRENAQASSAGVINPLAVQAKTDPGQSAPRTMTEIERKLIKAARECNFPEIVNGYFLCMNLDIRDESGKTLADLVTSSSWKSGKEIISRWLMRRGAASEGAPVTGRPLDARSVFGYARQGNEKEVIRGLALGISVNVRDSHGGTLLMVAASQNNCALIEELLSWGASLKPRNDDFRDVFTIASKAARGAFFASAYEKLLQCSLLRRNEAKMARTIPDIVLAAATSGNVELVEEYFDYHMDPEIMTQDGISLLDYANLAHEAEVAKAVKRAIDKKHGIDESEELGEDGEPADDGGKNVEAAPEASFAPENDPIIRLAAQKQAEAQAAEDAREAEKPASGFTRTEKSEALWNDESDEEAGDAGEGADGDDAEDEESDGDDVFVLLPENPSAAPARATFEGRTFAAAAQAVRKTSDEGASGGHLTGFQMDLDDEEDDDFDFETFDKPASRAAPSAGSGESAGQAVSADSAVAAPSAEQAQFRQYACDELRFILPVVPLDAEREARLQALPGLYKAAVARFIAVQKCRSRSEADRVCEGDLVANWEFFRMLKLYCDDLTRS